MNIFNRFTALFTRSHIKDTPTDASVKENEREENGAEIRKKDKAPVGEKFTLGESTSPELKIVDDKGNCTNNTELRTDINEESGDSGKTCPTIENVISKQQIGTENLVEDEEASETKEQNKKSESDDQKGEIPSDQNLCQDGRSISGKSSIKKDKENTIATTIETDEEKKDIRCETADSGEDMPRSSIDDTPSNSIQKAVTISCEFQKEPPEAQSRDLLAYLLNNSAPEFRGNVDGISYFGFSMQGYSHSDNNIKCQDKCAIREVGLSKKFVVAGIADGLGSCKFSDEGAAVAVSSALDKIEKFLALEENPTDDDIINTLKHSMRTAYKSVEQYADQKGEELNEYYSTLTVVIYNGKDAFIAHAGDDGVVVLTNSGFYGLVTTRHKGDTVNSVVPLQGETNWEFMIVRDIVGVVMATDGVLDAFVKREKEENRVFFPFVQILTKAEYDGKSILEKYKSLFTTKKVKEIITDDITFVSMIDDETMKMTEFQSFDEKEWFKKNRERSESIFKALYPDQKLTEDIADSWLDRDKELLFVLEQLKMF